MTMNTVVCVKQVPDSTIVKFDIRTNSLDNVHYILDPIDEVSVSEAINIRERNGGEVTAITLGPARAEAALRTCLKMGVDRAVHLSDEAFDMVDPHSVARILATYLSGLPCDLVLCGNRSMDQANGFVGVGIAAHMGLPLVTAVTRIDVFADTATAVVHRRLRGGDREIVETPLPAVLTVEPVLTDLIYPRLRTILAGMRKDIARMDAQSIGLDPKDVGTGLEVLSISQPKPRLKKTATIDSSLTPAERIKLITSGGVQQKSSKIVQKPPDAAAADIIRFLIENGIISKPQ